MAELEHGFTTREEWFTFFDYYFQQIEKYEGIAIVKKASSFHEWLDGYRYNSHQVYLQNFKNNDYLNRHVYYYAKQNHPWIKEVADSLLSYLFRYCTRFNDVEAAFYITESLYTYYEKQDKDEIALMKCILVKTICYAFLDNVHFKKTILYLCGCGITLYEKHYDRLNQEEKSIGLSIYDFQSSCMYEYLDSHKDYSNEFQDVLYPAYIQRMKMIDRFLLEADMNLDFNQAVPYIRQVWIDSFTALVLQIKKDQMTDKQIQILYDEANKQIDQSRLISKLIILMCEYYLLDKSGEEIYHAICSFTKEIPALYRTSNESINEAIYSLSSLAKALDRIEVERDKKIQASNMLLMYYSEIFRVISPNNYNEHAVDIAIYYYLIPLLKYNDDPDAVYNNLLKFTAFRQLQTTIHTIMVSSLAGDILSSVIENKPELIANAFHISLSEVKRQKEALLNYIKRAGLLHDVGKILCTNVINMQYRKLMDLEFQTIKFHPVTSYEILTEIPDLTCFRDIAAGHHENYNGIGGYPGIVDTQKSPQKIFIDLISICDSIDAATDTYGRNYTTPKNFQKVLEELNKEVGTRYSPDLVEFISSDKDLQAAIEDRISKGRIDIYQYMYQMLTS